MTAPAPALSRRTFLGMWLVPLVLLLLGTILFRLTDWDRQIGAHWFNPELGVFEVPGWVTFIYHYAPVPGMIIAIGSLLLLLSSLFAPYLRKWRRIAGFFALSMIVGPGLLVNAIFKDHWGRPRPRQVVEFRGEMEFLPVGTPGHEKVARSFPSGHASVAYFMLSPFFVLFARRRKLAWVALGGGLAWGTLVGIGRIAEGGHWASDVMWAAGMVYFAAFFLGWAFGFVHPERSAKR
jgi:membrane-associated PAP2 superfamily phosphatase